MDSILQQIFYTSFVLKKVIKMTDTKTNKLYYLYPRAKCINNISIEIDSIFKNTKNIKRGILITSWYNYYVTIDSYPGDLNRLVTYQGTLSHIAGNKIIFDGVDINENTLQLVFA